MTPIAIQRWVDQHCAEHGARRRVSLAHAVLRSALKDAQRLQQVSGNAAQLVRLPKVSKRAVTPLSMEESLRFRDEALQHPLGALFIVTIACGLRLGEALGLTWRDVDLQRGKLSIRQQLQQVGKQLLLQPVKTRKSERQLALAQVALEALIQHRQRQNEQRLKQAPDYADCELVFCTYSRAGDGRLLGTPLDPCNVRRVFYRILTNAKLARVRFHDLRHSAASLLIAQGTQLVEVSQLLGHSELRVTADLYAHLQEQTASRAARTMDDIFGTKAS